MPTNTSFKTITSINQSTPSDLIESNVMAFFEYGFLNIGAFTNVRYGVSGVDGGRPYQLRLSEDSRYTRGKVWEGFRKDWVWQSGIELAPVQPISISGIFVNNTFYPLSTSGSYAYKIDYPNGRVVFDNAISSTSTVTCEYSYRYVQIYNCDAPWWKKFQDNSFRIDLPYFSLYGSGSYSSPPEQRIQLPSIVIQAVPNVSTRGVELGSMSVYRKQEVKFTIITENNADFKFLHDVVVDQVEKTIVGFDKNAMIRGTGFPLNYNGSIAANAKSYPDLIKPTSQGGYEWNRLRFEGFRSWIDHTGSNSQEQLNNNAPFIRGTISGIIEVVV